MSQLIFERCISFTRTCFITAKIEEYIPIVGQPIIDDLRLISEKLKGKSMRHMNSASGAREAVFTGFKKATQVDIENQKKYKIK